MFAFSGERIIWTSHSVMKMRFYGLSEYRVKRIINSPKRKEKGIAENTVAMMQSAGTLKHPYEIWVMINDEKKESGKIRKIISAWKYPGITKPGAPLPSAIRAEMDEAEQLEKEEEK